MSWQPSPLLTSVVPPIRKAPAAVEERRAVDDDAVMRAKKRQPSPPLLNVLQAGICGLPSSCRRPAGHLGGKPPLTL